MKQPLFGKYHYYMFALDALFDGIVLTLTAGTFFAKLSTSLGVSDATTAILAQSGHLMIALYLVSSITARAKNSKPLIGILNFVYQLLITTIYVLPFFALDPGTTETLLLVILIGAKAISFTCAGAKSSWLVANIPKEKQSSVFGISQALVYVFLFFLSLVMGNVIDRMETAGNLRGAFLILFFILLGASVLNFVSILLTRAPAPKTKEEKSESLADTYRAVLKNKGFRSIAIHRLFYTVANTAVTAYQSTYLINEIGLPMTEVAVYTAIGTAVYAVSLAVWGKIGERRTQYYAYKAGMVITSVANLIAIFLAPNHYLIPYVLFTVIHQCGYAAYIIGYTVIYRLMPERHYAAALATGVIPQSLVAFGTTLVLAPLFNYLKDDLGGTLFGHTFYAQQTFAVIGTLVSVLSLLFLFLITNKHVLPYLKRSQAEISESKDTLPETVQCASESK